MTKKIIALLLALVLCAAAACYFLLPRPVIQDPENAAIQYIVIQKDPYYQEDASDYYLWEPKSEGDRAVEREILAYLAQSQETRTLRTNTDPDTYPPSPGSACTSWWIRTPETPPHRSRNGVSFWDPPNSRRGRTPPSTKTQSTFPTIPPRGPGFWAGSTGTWSTPTASAPSS